MCFLIKTKHLKRVFKYSKLGKNIKGIVGARKNNPLHSQLVALHEKYFCLAEGKRVKTKIFLCRNESVKESMSFSAG